MSHDPRGFQTASKLRCPRCLVGGYEETASEVDGRPMFKCSRCGHSWTCGKSGGKWKKEPR